MKKPLIIFSFLIFYGISFAQPSSTYRSITFGHGIFLSSENGVYTLDFKNDGNLVIYTYQNKAIWASNTGGL